MLFLWCDLASCFDFKDTQFKLENIICYGCVIMQINICILAAEAILIWKQNEVSNCILSYKIVYFMIFCWRNILFLLFLCHVFPLIYILVRCMSGHQAAACCGAETQWNIHDQIWIHKTPFRRRENGLKSVIASQIWYVASWCCL